MPSMLVTAFWVVEAGKDTETVRNFSNNATRGILRVHQKMQTPVETIFSLLLIIWKLRCFPAYVDISIK